LGLVNFFPHRRKQALAAVILAILTLIMYWVYRTMTAAKEGLNDRDKLQGLFDMFTLTRGDLSPSDWMSRGLLDVARGDLASALLPLTLIWSNGLLLYVVAAYVAKRLYRRGGHPVGPRAATRHRS